MILAENIKIIHTNLFLVDADYFSNYNLIEMSYKLSYNRELYEKGLIMSRLLIYWNEQILIIK